MGRDKEKARPVIPETMRAAVVEKFRQPLQIREAPVPFTWTWASFSPNPRDRRVSYRLARGRWRLAGQTDSAIYSPDMKVLVLWWRSARVSLT
jgi:hypothetical protein